MIHAALDELQRLARAYDYPPVRLVQPDLKPAYHFEVIGNALPAFEAVGLTFVPASVPRPYPEFEATISDDLRSIDETRLRLGFASVVFWGHYSDESGGARAAKRAAKTASLDAVQLRGDLAEIIALTDSGRLGEAMVRAFTLPEIGSTSFASKLITFLAPQRAGVLDKQIYDGLARTVLNNDPSALEAWLAREFGSWAWTAFGGAGETERNRVRIARGFDRWCATLTRVAQQLDSESITGPCGDWRAADVERAIYRALRTGRRGDRKRTKA